MFEPRSCEIIIYNQIYYKLLCNFADDSYQQMCFNPDKQCVIDFEDNMKNLKWIICDQCNEKFLSPGNSNIKCLHYENCWQFSGINNMDPGELPPELNLTFIEERLIARVHPIISVFMLTKGGQYGYKKNVINFSQNVDDFAKELPTKVKDLSSVIIVRKKGQDETYHDFNVCSQKVRDALIWLKNNNPLYKEIIISEENLQTLPENGNVTSEIQTIDDLRQESINTNITSENTTKEQDIENRENDVNHSCIPNTAYPHQDQQIKSYLDWPQSDSQPIDEYNTPGYIAGAFPSLFAYGKADLRDPRQTDIKPSYYFRHLLRYKDDRFAKHKTFRFFAYNTWLRWTALTDGNVFVRNNDQFKKMTVQNLKDAISENPNVLKKIMYHAKNLKGSKAYWYSRAGELRDMVNQLGMPTIFLTLSAADYHWIDLYRLLTGSENVTHLTEFDRQKLVRENPQVVDQFFDLRINAFLKHVSSISI